MTDIIATPVAAGGIAAIVGGVTLELLGLPYHSVIWGFVGALVTMSQMAMITRGRAFLYGLLSTLAGAAVGTFGAELFDLKSKSALIIGSLTGGAGAFAIIGALVRRFTKLAAGAPTVPAPLAPEGEQK